MNKKDHDLLITTLILWIPLAIVATALCGLIYITVQQNFRQTANDPQIELAEDVANELSLGVNPQSIVPPVKTDISKSLANFIMVFDSQGKLIISSATIGGVNPAVPQGVFSTARSKGETRFTWQPQPNVRSAAVVTYFKGTNSGFVLVGRSLREVEIRENNLEVMVFVVWIITLLASLSFVYYIQKFRS